MKICVLSIVLILWSTEIICAQEAAANRAVDTAHIKNQMRRNNIPNVAIGILDRGKLQDPILLSIDSRSDKSALPKVFDVASITKSISTMLTLKLVELGEWDLDEPLYNYWVDPDVQEDTLHKMLTSRHVLSHRSGFLNWRYLQDGILKFQFEPGTKFGYSGEGFEYLRKAIEQKFNKSFAYLVDSLVFEPLGMEQSYLTWDDEIDDWGFAQTYDTAGVQYDYTKMDKANAADNLLTSITDLGLFSEKILSMDFIHTDMYAEMIRVHSNVKDRIDFGLGWMVFNDLPNDEYAIFNAGSDKGVNALIVLLPKSGRGLIVFTNGDNGRYIAMPAISMLLGAAGQEILKRF